jgi:hypothetical protein
MEYLLTGMTVSQYNAFNPLKPSGNCMHHPLQHSVTIYEFRIILTINSDYFEEVYFYQTTRRYNPEDSHLRTHRRENLKSY